MKTPIKPIRPYAPSKPKEFLPAVMQSCTFYSDSTLKSILEQIGNVDLGSVSFDYDCDEGSHEFSFNWYTSEQTKNPKYEEQLEKYNAARLKYQQDMKVYNSNLKEYKSLEKAYLKWFHTNALEKLNF